MAIVFFLTEDRFCCHYI